MSGAWGEHTRPELADRDDTVVVLPTGAIEQHGPHLPVDTDTTIAAAIAHAAAKRTDNVLVLPPLPYGYSPHHRGLPGTLTLSSETYVAAIKDLLGSAVDAGFETLAVLNGHGGNASLLQTACSDFRDRRDIKVAVVTYWDLIGEEIEGIRESEPGGIAHGGEMETSLQLYLREDLVDEAPPADHLPDREGYMQSDLLGGGAVSYPGHFDELTDTGASGSPTAASVETGERIFDAATVAVADFFDDYRDWQ